MLFDGQGAMPAALIVTDMLNHYEHEDATVLMESVRSHSIFYQTQLEYLLRQSGIDRVIGGQVTEQCIFYSALDAYVRHFEVVIPRGTVAHIHPDLAQAAVQMMETNMRARIVAPGQNVFSDCPQT